MPVKKVSPSVTSALLRVGIALSACALSTTVFADDAATKAQASTAEPQLEEVVVTGTSLRGVAPAGAETVTFDTAQIQATSALSTDQLLADIPQLSSFGSLQTVNSGGTQLTVNRTNIRNLPEGVGGGSPTLVLMDGHRLVGMGVQQSYPDPDVIPPALIERVDVVTDGGSAIYGADAVGGVVNFITKKNFDGIDVGVRQGLGDSYRSTDVNFTAGKAWSSGSAYVGYNYSRHDGVYGSARSYVRNINYATGLPASDFCSPANAVVGGATYAVVGGNSLSLSNANLCDTSKTSVFFPEELRNSVMAGFRQEFTDSLEFEVKGYYSERDDTADGGPLTGSGTVYGAAVPASPGFPAFGVPPTPAIAVNPNYITTGGGSTATQTVYFNFAPVGGRAIVTTTLMSAGLTPTLTWKIGHDWQMKAYYNYGESRTVANDPGVNATALGNDITAGTINPYNIAASDTSALGQVLNWTGYGIGKDKLSNAKATFDGPLYTLWGNEIRVAAGAEYSHEQFQGYVNNTGNTIQNETNAPLNSSSRNVTSEFAELNIPLVGPGNNVPMLYSLNLAAAERHDDYSDFGGNWAPNFGLTLKPVSWVGLRARWNRSFQAPSLVQLAAAGSPTPGVYPGAFTQFDPLLINPAVTPNGGPIVAVAGTLLPLQPERATDYNFGFDISPPVLEGLDLHITYFNIDYTGQIGTPPLGYGVFWGVPTFANLVLSKPSNAQLSSFLANAGVTAAGIAQAIATVNALGGNTYYAADIRSRNLGISKVHGLDYSLNYHHAVPFGTVYASFNSSFTSLAINAADGVNFGTNQAGINGPHFNSATVIGATVGENIRGQLTWNHLGSFNLSTPAGLGQTSVGAFNTVDFYAQYDLGPKLKNLPPISLSLGISNLFDTNPPAYNGSNPAFGSGYANGSTVGRVFQLGANVKF